tara:strand:- start:439 stop:1377 length:939 start_codon:yes stop_codon:yes gene_type:complete
MKNFLYFAENLVETGGAGADQEAFMVPASYFLGADPISATTTALYFKDPVRDNGNRIKVLLDHATTANGGGYKEVVRALSSAMNKNTKTNDGFVVFADEEADNGTITGAASKSAVYDKGYLGCTPGTPALTAGAGGVQITSDADMVTSASGAGVVSTDFGAPEHRVWTENGTIITEVKFSLEGLTVSSTANDICGLASGAAYLYQYKTATHGILFRQELSCLSVAAGGGTTDINVVYNAAADLARDGTDAGGTTYGVDGGGISSGGTVVNDAAATPTNNHYAYITSGDTNGDGSAFTDGHYIYRTYGHAALA